MTRCGPDSPTTPCGDKTCIWHYGSMPDQPGFAGLLGPDDLTGCGDDLLPGDSKLWRHAMDATMRPHHRRLDESGPIDIRFGLGMETDAELRDRMTLTHIALVADPPDPNCIISGLGIHLEPWQQRAFDILMDGPPPAPIVFTQRIHERDMPGWLEMMDHLAGAASVRPPFMAMDFATPDGDRTTLTHGRVMSFDPATGRARIKFGRRKSKGWRRHLRNRKARARGQ